MIFKSPYLQLFVNFLLPPQCALCNEITKQPYTLCSECWPRLKFITSPACTTCGIPLEGVDHNMDCADCLKHPPIFTKAYAPLVYNDDLKKLILRYKNYDGLHLGPMFATWMQRCIPHDFDMLIPVPLHFWRFFSRQYNQAHELCKLLAKSSDKPINPNLLKRHKATQAQGRKSRYLRYENIKDAFKVDDPHNLLKNARIVLVDDVLTSGATANACAKALLDAGAKSVEVLTIARAVKNNHGKS